MLVNAGERRAVSHPGDRPPENNFFRFMPREADMVALGSIRVSKKPLDPGVDWRSWSITAPGYIYPLAGHGPEAAGR